MAGTKKKKKPLKKKPRKKPPLVPVPKGLTERQEKLRKIIVATGGLIDSVEAARVLGTTRSSVWTDRRVIRAFEGPRDLDGWDEDEAIRSAIDFYDGAMVFIIGELQQIEDYETAKKEELKNLSGDWTKKSKVFNIYNSTNLKIGLLNVLGNFRRDLNNFLIQIGLIEEAPSRVQVEGLGVSDAMTDKEMGALLQDVKKELEALRRHRNRLEKKGKGKKK